MIRLSETAVRSGSQAGILRRVAVRHAIPAFGGHLRPIGYSISKIGALLKQRLLRRRIFSQAEPRRPRLTPDYTILISRRLFFKQSNVLPNVYSHGQ
jgi:hypothetical protein